MIMKLCLRQNKNEDHCLGSGLFLSKISWKYPSDFDIFLCMLSLYWECLEKDKGARILKDKKQKISFDKRYLLLLVAGFLTGCMELILLVWHCLLRWQRSERAGNFWLFLFWQACLAAQKDFRLLSISRSFCLFCHSKKYRKSGQAIPDRRCI